MAHTTLIDPAELAAHVGDDSWAIVDCRFDLANPSAGRAQYTAAHIAGAVYAHLDDDLSGTVIPNETGRHPLPTPTRFADTLSRWGIDGSVQVVAYDDSSGAIASRLWWLLRWLGHDEVAVLNGGYRQWVQQGLPTQNGTNERTPRAFQPRVRRELAVSARDVLERVQQQANRLLDSRAPERFRGAQEPIDPIAGRIPGAVNAPHYECVGADGRIRSADELRKHFRSLIGETPASNCVFYCGSGVTAAHNLLAFAHAGLGEALLYPGSWSEWITDKTRPVATG